MEGDESWCFLVRKIRKEREGCPFNRKITIVQHQRKSGDRVHCTWYNPSHRG